MPRRACSSSTSVNDGGNETITPRNEFRHPTTPSWWIHILSDREISTLPTSTGSKVGSRKPFYEEALAYRTEQSRMSLIGA
jgi:hypothetical protein